ncbi:MAG TPA: DUF6468 domain-containing protein [Ferrovibrio sp.]|jgi:hypothetical protein|uniref:DUF6468 domain-containing protein n=1 Tax=Ferrovibrio sp. TaxID=1917215 RepID=UPI002ED18129
MTLSLVVEIVVAVLLVITLSISLVLNRRLGNLRANQDEMRRLIADFDKALIKARQGMNELKAASAAADTAHEENLKQARALRDELSFMIETADRLADRLAGEAANTRAVRQQQAVPERKPDMAKAPVTPFRKPVAAAGSAAQDFKLEPRSEAERELLMALRQTR